MDFYLLEKPNKNNIEWIFQHPDIEHENRQRLTQYCFEILQNGGRMNIGYKKNKYGDVKIGRFYPNGESLFATYQPKAVRSALFSENDVDIDMSSAHQNILINLLRINGVSDDEMNHVIYYVNNRDKIIKDFKLDEQAIPEGQTKKSLVKSLFTITLYGGNILTWKNEFNLESNQYRIPNFYNKYRREVEDLINKLVKIQKFSDFIEPIHTTFKTQFKNITDRKLLYKTASILLQEEEANIIFHIIKFLKKNNILCTSYCYDGFQISKDDFQSENMPSFEIINQSVEDKFGYSVPIIVKEWAEPLSPIKVDPFKTAVGWLVYETTDTNFLKVLKQYSKSNIMSNKGIFYKYENGCWKHTDQGSIATLHSKLVDYTKEYIYNCCYDKNERKAIIRFISSSRNFKTAVKMFFEDQYKQDIQFDEQGHLLNTPTGTLNLDTMELQPHDPNDYITLSTNVGVEMDKIKDYGKYLFDSCFRDWFQTDGINDDEEAYEDMECFLSHFARSLNGALENHKIYVLYGKLSRNGKGTFSKLFKSIMGSYYADNFPLDHFQGQQKANSPMPYLINVIGRRFIELSEPEDSTNDKNPPFKVGTLKSFSGKDPISTRDLYQGSKSMITFRPQGTLVFSTNNNLKFTKQADAGVMNRLCYFPFNNWFGDESFSHQGWSEKRPECKRINIRFAQNIGTNDFKSAFFHHLLYLYKKHEIDGIPLPRSKRFEDFHKDCLDDLDSVGEWANTYLQIDTSPFNNKDDAGLFRSNPNLESKLKGKNRVITFEYLFKMYNSDNQDNPIPYKDFCQIIDRKYSDLSSGKKKTKLFGKKKKYIKDLRYNGFDEEEKTELGSTGGSNQFDWKQFEDEFDEETN